MNRMIYKLEVVMYEQEVDEAGTIVDSAELLHEDELIGPQELNDNYDHVKARYDLFVQGDGESEQTQQIEQARDLIDSELYSIRRNDPECVDLIKGLTLVVEMLRSGS